MNHNTLQILVEHMGLSGGFLIKETKFKKSQKEVRKITYQILMNPIQAFFDGPKQEFLRK